jgi:hypothetical protein
MRCLIWITLFAVATACWFFHFRWDSDNRSGWSQIPMASAYGFGTIESGVVSDAASREARAS